MGTVKRKIQLIAGSTYTVSLPKEWVRKNNLKEKKEVLLREMNNKTLVISPEGLIEQKLNKIKLDLSEYSENIEQILFAVYYLGIEEIEVYSKQKIDKTVRTKIRKVLTNMSGTEISYEDNEKIAIRVLLDKSRINIDQIFYRISLLIDASLSNLLGKINMAEIRMNEDEIDRLYHLIAKMVSLSLIDSNILHSSKIKNVSLIPSYFLMGKRLEHIGDNINHLAKYIVKTKGDFLQKKQIFETFKTELKRSLKYFLGKKSENFKKLDLEGFKKLSKAIKNVNDAAIKVYLSEILRYIMDVQEELVNMSFYSKLIAQGQL